MSAANEVVAAFLDELEARCRRRAGRAEPRTELTRLGFVPAVGEAPVWTEMGVADWFELLSGMARHEPGLAVALSGLRLASDHGGGPGSGWALNIRHGAGRWQFCLPRVRETFSEWFFCDDREMYRVSAASLCPVAAADCFECSDAQAQSLGPCSAALRARMWRDRLALANGCLWRLWSVAIEHAESRPMFQRQLGDFPVIRFRLLSLLLHLLRADELTERAAALPPTLSRLLDAPSDLAGALRLVAQDVRVETQQICGGSGYMRESEYAQALSWFDWCDTLLRQGPMAEGLLSRNLLLEIEASVTKRLSQADTATAWRSLLPPAGSRGASAARTAV